MVQNNLKQVAQQLIDNLPEDASWEDLMYMISVRQSIESGLKDSNAGRVLPVEEVRKRFRLSR